MIRFLRWLFRMGTPPIQVWTVKEQLLWHKVVSPYKPIGFYDSQVIGPWRSEVDAEEFCDRVNRDRHDAPHYQEKRR